MPWGGRLVRDTNCELQPALEYLHPGNADVVTGVHGDVRRVDIRQVQGQVHGLVSGPSCQPHTSMGLQLGSQDARSPVFEVVCQWIIHLAVHNGLLFFILENEEGIMKRLRGQSQSYGNRVMDALRAAPELQGWCIQMKRLNSIQCGVPQSRPRIFFAGVAPCVQRSPYQRRMLTKPHQDIPKARLVAPLGQECSGCRF